LAWSLERTAGLLRPLGQADAVTRLSSPGCCSAKLVAGIAPGIYVYVGKISYQVTILAEV
jgi:hypothetical protein